MVQFLVHLNASNTRPLRHFISTYQRYHKRERIRLRYPIYVYPIYYRTSPVRQVHMNDGALLRSLPDVWEELKHLFASSNISGCSIGPTIKAPRRLTCAVLRSVSRALRVELANYHAKNICHDTHTACRDWFCLASDTIDRGDKNTWHTKFRSMIVSLYRFHVCDKSADVSVSE